MDDAIVGRHLTSGELARLVAGELVEAEVQNHGNDLLSCRECRSRTADLLRRPIAKSMERIREAVKLADAEAGLYVSSLLARAEWERLRRLPKNAQRDRLVLSRACHTREFLSLLLSVVKQPSNRTEAETAARLSILAIQGLDPGKWSDFERGRLAASVWIELANSRRLAAEWDAADDALKRATPLIKDSLVEARWLSISASLQSDRGFSVDAIEKLESCRRLYEAENDWLSAARTLVQMGHIFVDHDPKRGIAVLETARPLVAGNDPALLWLLELIRTECFIETSQILQALHAFRAAEALKSFEPRPRAEIRSKFTTGRLLEALGHRVEAERLFEEVVAQDLEHSLLKDAFLDLLYLFAFYVKAGESDRAAELGRRALSQLELLDSIHDQLKTVWNGLISAAEERTLDLQHLSKIKEYLRVWWKRPGPELSWLDCRGRTVESAEGIREAVKLADAEAGLHVSSLLARAEWENLRRLPKDAQRDRLVLSRACHTREFLSLLLSVVKQPSNRAEAETAARLSILSIKGLDRGKWSDFEGEKLAAIVWIELANSRRLAAEWDAADDALKRASPLIKDSLVEARWLSISASLQSDRGFGSDAIEKLEKCRCLYEAENDWLSVARTLVQMGHILVDSDPKRGIAALERARPLISGRDPLLLWLLELIKTECLIETSQIFQALDAFRAAEALKKFHPRPRAEIRSKFTGGRILEALGHRVEAERLFEEVVAQDLEYSLLKDVFLDLLYLFAFYVKAGEPDRAAELGRRALTQLELLGSIHEQLKTVWKGLIGAADRRALDLRLLPTIKEYLRVWWKRPGPELSLGEVFVSLGLRKL